MLIIVEEPLGSSEEPLGSSAAKPHFMVSFSPEGNKIKSTQTEAADH